MSGDSKELTNGLGVAAEKAFDFIEKIIAAPIIEGTGILTDKIQFWRIRNKVKLIEKTREFLKEKGISIPNKVPLKDISTLLEYASFEEEEQMQDSWANLLTNTLNPNIEFDACFLFSQILNQLSINEVYVLKHIFERSFVMHSEDRPYLEKKELINVSLVGRYKGVLLIDNLMRLRMIEEKVKYQPDNSGMDIMSGGHIVTDKRYFYYRISHFGTELIKHITI